MGAAIRMKDSTGRDVSINPARMIEHFYPTLLSYAGQGLLEKRWEPWLEKFLRDNGVTEEELAKTVAAYTKFCGWACDPERKDMAKALKESGFFDVSHAAQIAFGAKLFQLVTGAFWAGIRDSARDGGVPYSVETLAKAAKKMEAYISGKWSAKDGKGSVKADQPSEAPRPVAPEASA